MKTKPKNIFKFGMSVRKIFLSLLAATIKEFWKLAVSFSCVAFEVD